MPSLVFSSVGWHSWNVPKGVKDVEVTLKGAGSDSTPGGLVVGHMAVDDDWTVWFYIGERGRGPSGTGSRTGGAATDGGGGRGGNGVGSGTGGWSGGGATYVRIKSKTGTVKGVAGGAGGRSGDSSSGGPQDDGPPGRGGMGGASTGEAGFRGTAGVNNTGNATGGTQSQGGNGGTSSAHPTDYNGGEAGDTFNARGGAGGDHTSGNSHGGGGGGGGYRSGGGGQASQIGYSPGGGGGAGSNYSGGIKGGGSSTRGEGGTLDGDVRLEWVQDVQGNDPPMTPTTIRIDGRAETAEPNWTKNKSRVSISGVLNDPNRSDRVRLVVQYSAQSNFSGSKTRQSVFVAQLEKENEEDAPHTSHSGKATLVLDNLSQNTRYYGRAWAEDNRGKKSQSYNSFSFWTNRYPTAPTLGSPAENTTWNTLVSIPFTWTHNDPDPSDPQKKFDLQYQQAGNTDSTKVTTITRTTNQSEWVSDPGDFKSNHFYEWRVRTYDQQDARGAWSVWRSIYVVGVSSPPELRYPAGNNTAIDVGTGYTFAWQFKDPNAGDSQSRADFRYRVAAGNTQPHDDADSSSDPPAADWIIKFGEVDPGVPGKNEWWWMPPDTFQPGLRYQWEVRTYDSYSGTGIPSQWSEPRYFRTVTTPGGAVEPPIVTSEFSILGTLGCGTYRVFAFAQPNPVTRRSSDSVTEGHQLLGELPISALTFDRVRDDISHCNITIKGFGPDCGDLLASLRSWMHEIVVYRDGHRVWEGPIVRLTYTTEGVGIEAMDVMAYLYRRIMKQGYNDAYRISDNIKYGPGNDPNPVLTPADVQMTVVRRARQIAMDAFAEHDPDVLPYLTTFDYPDDATQGRIVSDYSKTAWEEIDDLAATAGLDYVTIGRRILFWDTHRPIGRLAGMRDGDFSDPPVVSEYGMQLCNHYAVTNNSGLHGSARPHEEEFNGQAYGPVELIASAYGETDSLDDMSKQAQRNLSNRWPTPLIVRVPDNSTLNPAVNVTFDQLVPGVWIPLQAHNTLRKVAQWQKLDRVTVEFAEGKEQVMVVMSPAPNHGQDPDEAEAAEEEGGSS